MRAWQAIKVSSTDPAAARSLFFVGAVDGPADESVDEPADEPIDEPADDPIDEPADEPTEVLSLAQAATIIPSKTMTPKELTDWTAIMKPLPFEKSHLIESGSGNRTPDA